MKMWWIQTFVHHKPKTTLTEFRKSFGHCDKIYFRECELRRRIRDYCKKVKVNVTGM